MVEAVDTCPSTIVFCIKYVPNLFKNQKICHKTIDKRHFKFDSVSNQFKTQELCD